MCWLKAQPQKPAARQQAPTAGTRFHNMRGTRMQICIGGITFEVRLQEQYGKNALRVPYQCFIQKPSRKPDFVIEVRTERVHWQAPGKTLFDTEYSWALRAYAGEYLYQDKLTHTTRTAYVRRALIDTAFKRAVIFCSKKALIEKGVCNWLFDVPLGQFLAAHILARKQGIILHSCGIRYKNSGIVCMGPSGAGKSTLADIWKQKKGAVVLSDERVVLRTRTNGFMMHGTPWTGSSCGFAQARAPLTKIYLIEHAPDNWCVPVRAAQALPVFLSNIRLPLWDKEKTADVIATAHAVLSSVPIFRLGFKPNADVLALIAR